MPLWRRLAERKDIETKVFYGTDMSVRGYQDAGFGVSLQWDSPLVEGYSHEFLSVDPRIQRVSFWQPGFCGIFRRLKMFAPDVVVLTAYGSLFHLGALFAARLTRAHIVIRHEASDVAEARSQFKSIVRDWMLRRLYSQIDRFAAIGTEARTHLSRLGVAGTKIGYAPYCVDTDFIECQIASWGSKRTSVREALGIGPGDIVLVFSGKLIPKKDPLLILAAISLLPKHLAGRLHLVVAGDGNLRARLDREGRQILGRRLHLLGFLNQTEIGKAYISGDCLVLPSRKGTGETWGLVVNEAMQFGLPAIVSDAVGCHRDLVRDGETGYVFSSGSAISLAGAISRLTEAVAGGRRALGKNARSHVEAFSLQRAADGLSDSILSIPSVL